MSAIYSKDCKRQACGRGFTTTRANVVYCSTRCARLDDFARLTASTKKKSLTSIKPEAVVTDVEKPTWVKIRDRVFNHFRGPLWRDVEVEKLLRN